MRGIISFACLIEADIEKFFFKVAILSCILVWQVCTFTGRDNKNVFFSLAADQDDSVRDHIVTFMPVAMVVLVRIQVGVSHGCN